MAKRRKNHIRKTNSGSLHYDGGFNCDGDEISDDIFKNDDLDTSNELSDSISAHLGNIKNFNATCPHCDSNSVNEFKCVFTFECGTMHSIVNCKTIKYGPECVGSFVNKFIEASDNIFNNHVKLLNSL